MIRISDDDDFQPLRCSSQPCRHPQRLRPVHRAQCPARQRQAQRRSHKSQRCRWAGRARRGGRRALPAADREGVQDVAREVEGVGAELRPEGGVTRPRPQAAGHGGNSNMLKAYLSRRAGNRSFT